MTYELVLGNYAYSSWSMRGWLLLEQFGLSYRVHLVDFGAAGSVAEQMAQFAPARTVPTMIASDGAIISDSLAMAEELATRHPQIRFWPQDPLARATARTLAAEMHSGFVALRGECPMNLLTTYRGVSPSEAVQADLARLEVIWDNARSRCKSSGPWLFGDYCVADAFFAPVAARIAGYGLVLSDGAQAYVNAHLTDPAFRRWRAMGIAQAKPLARYAKPMETGPWPGPAPKLARAVNSGFPENATCPYSGSPVTHLMESEGRIFGFCNAFCRDKTVADADAWPAFVAMRDALSAGQG